MNKAIPKGIRAINLIGLMPRCSSLGEQNIGKDIGLRMMFLKESSILIEMEDQYYQNPKEEDVEASPIDQTIS